MKAFFAICMIVSATFVWAGERPVQDSHEAASASGEVLEVRRGSIVTIETTILSGTLADSEEGATEPAKGTITPPLIRAAFTGDSRVARASGANARTVAEVVTRSAELKDQIVAVRGKVVKYHPEIMGLNWVHLRDGTGSAVDNSNDLLVTTTQETRIGETVTARGVVRTDMDFGAGYAYKVLIEGATLQ